MNREAEVRAVLQGIEQRSAQTRRRYLDGIREMADAADSDRGQVSCSNLGFHQDTDGGFEHFVAQCLATPRELQLLDSLSDSSLNRFGGSIWPFDDNRMIGCE